MIPLFHCRTFLSVMDKSLPHDVTFFMHPVGQDTNHTRTLEELSSDSCRFLDRNMNVCVCLLPQMWPSFNALTMEFKYWECQLVWGARQPQSGFLPNYASNHQIICLKCHQQFLKNIFLAGKVFVFFFRKHLKQIGVRQHALPQIQVPADDLEPCISHKQ